MNHRKVLFDFVLERAEAEPARRRADIYEALAEFCGDRQMAGQLRAMASDFRKADHRCREFGFKFTQEEAQ